MKLKLRFPTPYTVLMLVIAFATLLAYVLPSGTYDTLSYQSENHQFIIRTKDSVYSLPATQQVLEENHIRVQLLSFTEGKIKKPISIPNTYHPTQAETKGWLQILFAPIKGIYEAIDIILFVLILGGFIGVFNSSGTLNQGVGYLAHRLRGREGILIILVTTLIALGGTSFGLAEETLAFYPLLVPVFLAAGYDLMVPLAVIFLGSCIGTMASTINPFSVIIASDSAGVNWTTGIGIRLLALVVSLFITIAYIIRYAQKVRKNPEESIVYGVDIPSTFSNTKADSVEKLSLSAKLLLSVFALTFIVMILGVSQWGWWFEEMTALFLVASVLIAFLLRTSEEQFIQTFLTGANDLLGVAFIIGIARGVNYVLEEGQISDTIVYYATDLIGGMSPVVFLPVLMFIFMVLTLFIASSSGMAVITMPIMGALAATIGIQGDNVVNAYLFGMGLMSIITPTGLVLPSLAMVNINLKQWFKFVIPLMLMLIITLVGILLLGYFL